MNIMTNVKDITALMHNPSKEGQELVTRAYEFAQNAHEGHTRYSGEPYFNHLVETAKTLAQIGMGPRTIAAGLLHDSIEDVDIQPEDIEQAFGTEILFLVQGVTKLGHIKYRGAERHTESLRKLFVATSQDIRVLMIKLADRLHNMRTLHSIPREDKRKRIAMETLEIYAPLAYRLGVRKLHRELEDLAFQYAQPEEYAKVAELLKKRDAEMQRRLDNMLKSLKKALAKEGLRDVATDSRVKGYHSLYRKLERKNWDMTKVYDVAAIRIVVPTISDCYTALGIIHSTWRPLPGRIKDYIAFPKPNGYQSLHTTIFTGDGGIIEIQIRTKQMHLESEYGIASHISYKEGGTKKAAATPNLMWLTQFLPNLKKSSNTDGENASTASDKIATSPNWLQELVEVQESVSEPQEFIKNLQVDFFEHRIFVFTPQGDVVDLPVESSPIDFAFAIHSDIGMHTSGAKVNGKLVSLDTKLRNGDIVEINTKKSSRPTRKWLDFAKTTLARRKIRTALQQENSH